jgi:hypothetical protein
LINQSLRSSEISDILLPALLSARGILAYDSPRIVSAISTAAGGIE